MGVVIVAAGKGMRMGTAERKQYLLLQDKPVLVHTLDVFEAVNSVDEIVVVVGEDDVERCRQYVNKYGFAKVRSVISGGLERQHSVFRGLRALSSEVEWVLVHDGVRPFVTEKQILACWQGAMEHDASVLAVPVKDTIKTVDAAGQIVATPDRRSLWAIQTPQAFRRSLLQEAHERAAADHFTGTDDAVLVERLGFPVHVVEGNYSNIKLTTPEDLLWANWLLAQRGGTGE